MKVAMSPSRVLCGVLIACAGSSTPVWGAQPDPAADPKFAPAAERARQEGDKVYKWILINGAAPKRPDQAASAAAASAASAPAPRRLVRTRPEGPPAAAKPPERSTAVAQKAQPGAAAASAAGEDASAAAIPRGDDITTMPPTPNASSATTASSPQEGEDPPLVLVSQVEPEYPAPIVRRQKKGSVLVRFEVQVDGSVKQPEVLKSSNSRLEAAVVQAVAQWRFQPLPRPQSASAELAFDATQLIAE